MACYPLVLDENSWICEQCTFWWDGLSYLDLHHLPSSHWILSMIELGLNSFLKFADENFFVCFFGSYSISLSSANSYYIWYQYTWLLPAFGTKTVEYDRLVKDLMHYQHKKAFLVVLKAKCSTRWVVSRKVFHLWNISAYELMHFYFPIMYACYIMEKDSVVQTCILNT